jgi:protein involved in polysaccharide export with SLBB domain
LDDSGKERLLRFSRLFSFNSVFRTTAVSAFALCSLAALSGCDSKSLFDPSEMGRYKNQPLAMPILTTLDPAVEGGNDPYANAADPKPEDMRPSKGDYTVSKNDLVQITVSDLGGPGVETTKVARVSDSGNISLPYLNSLHAAGLTEIELEQAIIEAYRNANLIQNAQVSVTVVEARGRTFSILGAVGAPGEYAIVDSDFRVLNALVLARDTTVTGLDYLYIVRQNDTAGPQQAAPAEQPGATPPATPPTDLAPKSEAPSTPGTPVASNGEHVLTLLADAPTTAPSAADAPVIVPPPTATDSPVPAPAPAAAAPAGADQGFAFNEPSSDESTRIIRIPLQALKDGDLRYNIPIRARDILIVPVPEAGEFYMGGHVSRPGAFTLTARKITLKEAVVSAGMLDSLAIPQRTDIIRRVRPDHEIFVRVDLSMIFAGEQPDVYLKPYDQVMVGTNALAPFIAAARGAFRITYGFGFLYDRNFSPNNNSL